MPMSQGHPATTTPAPPVTWSATSDPHSWELMGGGGRAGHRLRSMAARLKVRTGRDPGWLGCATVATSGQDWNLRHREDMICLARSRLSRPLCPLCHADWVSGSDPRGCPETPQQLGTPVASKAESQKEHEPLSTSQQSPCLCPMPRSSAGPPHNSSSTLQGSHLP